mgnify:FL=1
MIHSKYISRNLSDLEKLAKELVPLLNEGGVMTLNGQIGAGKTTLAKLIIQELTQTPLEDIVSPTFNLYHTYNKDNLEIAHYDFYRIESEIELLEIDLNESLTDKICIIEWADKFRDLLPKDRIEIFIKCKKNERVYRINPLGKFREVVSDRAKIENYLGGLDINFTELQRLPGDASKRNYYRVMSPDNTMILMDATQESNIKSKTGLSNGIDDFIKIQKYLDSIDVRVPKLIVRNRTDNILLEEDLGEYSYADMLTKENYQKLYNPAIKTLIHISNINHPKNISTDSNPHYLKEFDLDIYLNEAEIFIDYYWPFIHGKQCNADKKQEFTHVMGEVYSNLTDDKTLMLRDFHSPNLLFLENEDGFRKCAVIDFQDALFGHPLYDLVSLTNDARTTIDEHQEKYLIDLYKKDFPFNNFQFDSLSFIEQYHILGVQRSIKILGIFARLAILETNQNYLVHMPRVICYIKRIMQSGSIQTLACWLNQNFKETFDV